MTPAEIANMLTQAADMRRRRRRRRRGLKGLAANWLDLVRRGQQSAHVEKAP